MKNFIFKNKKKYYSNYICKLVLQECLLFIDWVNSFDTNNHIWDEWGLFVLAPCAVCDLRIRVFSDE